MKSYIPDPFEEFKASHKKRHTLSDVRWILWDYLDMIRAEIAEQMRRERSYE